MNLSADQAARLLVLAERLKRQARRAFMDAERCPLNVPAPPDWQRRSLEMAAMVDANAAWAIEAILGASSPPASPTPAAG